MIANPVSQQTRPATLGQLPQIRRGDGTPIQVLLVDDERALTNLVTMALRYEGWGVEVAHDSVAALEHMRQQRPDLILLDWLVPGMGGAEATAPQANSRPSTTAATAASR